MVLKKNLIIEHVLGKMFEGDHAVKQHILSIKKKEDGIQRFIEYLQWCPLEEYQNFIRVLYTTQQASLAGQLVASCEKCLYNLNLNFRISFILILNIKYYLIIYKVLFLFVLTIDDELLINVTYTGHSEENKDLALKVDISFFIKSAFFCK